MENKNVIYHIVTLNDLKNQIINNHYKPNTFENDGFIHCTHEKSTTLLVLEDYFVEVSKKNIILILEIDTTKLKSEVKYEPPAPIQNTGTSHIMEGILFPHIYGSINIDAIIGTGKVERVNNKFSWPVIFNDIKEYL